MDIFSVILLFGGLTFFLYGMSALSNGLEKMTGGKFEEMLRSVTSSKVASILLGAGVTIAIQSSSAMTVMLVGFVNSGLMELSQTISIIMGSNIGTTLTAWIFSLSGIDSNSIGMKMLKPENFALVVAFIGILMTMLSKKSKKKDLGNVLVGFGILMYGMKMMSSACEPLAESSKFAEMLTAFNNPLLGVLVGTVFTAIIQSSAASIGILQALALTGSISYQMAVPLILGLNIGTCATALISSLGVNKNAKRVAVVHTVIKVIGTIVFLIVYYVAKSFISLEFMQAPINGFGIAAVHSIFNILNTIILLPFSNFLVRIAYILVPGKTDDVEKTVLLDELLLNTPSLATKECLDKTKEMAKLAVDSINGAIELMHKYSKSEDERLTELEDQIDQYEDKLGTFLVKLSAKDVSGSDSKRVALMLHCISDYERMGDHALNLVETGREIFDKDIKFSSIAIKELDVLTSAIQHIIRITYEAYNTTDIEKAALVEPLEEVIDILIDSIKSGHIERLRTGNCTIEYGFILNDILTNYERISDHCSNIAVAIIENRFNSYDTHEYLNGVKTGKDENFNANFKAFSEQYVLPNA